MTPITPLITPQSVQTASWSAITTSSSALAQWKDDAPSAVNRGITKQFPVAPLTFKDHPLRARTDWVSTEFRQGYMEAAAEEGIAWQIRAIRRDRNMTQKQLARLVGTTQSGISRLEDPEYGKHSIDTLIAIANAFDCALSIKFISYAELASNNEDLSPSALVAESFSNQRYMIES